MRETRFNGYLCDVHAACRNVGDMLRRRRPLPAAPKAVCEASAHAHARTFVEHCVRILHGLTVQFTLCSAHLGRFEYGHSHEGIR